LPSTSPPMAGLAAAACADPALAAVSDLVGRAEARLVGPASVRAFVAATVAHSLPLLVVTATGRDADDLTGELTEILGGAVAQFPSWETLPHERLSPSADTVGRRLEVLAVPLDDLRAAGKAAGGTVNDAYLAGLSGGLRRYHEHLGAPVDELPLAMPVSTRTDDDSVGGNHFSAVRLAAPVGLDATEVRHVDATRDEHRWDTGQGRSKTSVGTGAHDSAADLVGEFGHGSTRIARSVAMCSCGFRAVRRSSCGPHTTR